MAAADNVVPASTMARLLDMTPRRLQQLVKEGMPKSERGRYPLVACVQWYVKYLRARIVESGGAGEAGASNRERMLAARAALAELEVKEREGEVIPWMEVENIFATAYSNVSSRLRSVPDEVAEEVASAESPNECKQIIAHAINEALNELAGAEVRLGSVRKASGSGAPVRDDPGRTPTAA